MMIRSRRCIKAVVVGVKGVKDEFVGTRMFLDVTKTVQNYCDR